MTLRVNKAPRPIPPKPGGGDGGKSIVRKPAAPIQKPIEEEAPERGSSRERENYTSTFRTTKALHDMIESVMADRDCSKSEAIKYCVRIVGTAMRYENARVILDNGPDSEPQTLPIRDGGISV